MRGEAFFCGKLELYAAEQNEIDENIVTRSAKQF
jgi:hypothetical protein